MQKEFILGIGSQRAGSTFLARLLDQHPRIAFHPLKELHYFDTLFHVRQEQALKDFSKAQLTREINRLCNAEHLNFVNPRWKWYLQSNFELLTTPISEIDYASLFSGHEKLANKNIKFIGESTPEYMLLNAEQISKMKAVLGDSRIILICRNPIKRTISSFRLMIEYNRQSKTEEQLNQLFLDLIGSENIWIKNQVRYSQYRKVFERYQRSFDKILLLPYDDVIENPIHILKKLSNFLSLNFETPKMLTLFDRKVNSLDVKYSPSDEVMRKLDRLLCSLNDEADELLGRSLVH